MEPSGSIESALRDILFMYKTFTDFGGIFEDLGKDAGTFDAFHYVDFGGAELLSEDDTRLLREGSALRLLALVLEAWSQREYPKVKDVGVEKVKGVLADGRLNHVPDIAAAITRALDSNDYKAIGGAALYKKYVLGYFRQLADSDEFLRTE